MLESWIVAEKASISRRRAEAAGVGLKGRDPAFWHAIHRAVELVMQYEAALDNLALQGRDVGHYRAFVPRICEAIYAPECLWNSNQGGNNANAHPDVIHNLRAAGDALEGLTGTPDSRQIGLRRSLRTFAAFATTFVTSGHRQPATNLNGLLRKPFGSARTWTTSARPLSLTSRPRRSNLS